MKDFHKMKLYDLLQILKDYTDETHGITVQEIIEQLALYGIQAERKSIYRDIACLNRYSGFQIRSVKAAGGKNYYFLDGKQFSLAELKFLTDAVLASRSLSEKESEQLIRKLGTLGSRYEARILTRQAELQLLKKTENETVLQNVGILVRAISEKKQVCLEMMEWNRERRLKPEQNGIKHVVLPLALIWKDEYYYLVAQENGQKMLQHYRTDKMQEVYMISDAACIQDAGEKIQAETDIRLELSEAAIGMVLDRFGSRIPLISRPDGKFETRVQAVLTDELLCWMMSLSEVRVLEPVQAVEQLRRIGRRIESIYGCVK